MKLLKWGLGGLALAVAAGVIGFALVGSGGSASAAPGDDIKAQRAHYEEVLAAKLGVSVAALNNAQTAARDQIVNEMLAAGKLTPDQANKIKQRPAGDGFFRLPNANAKRFRPGGTSPNLNPQNQNPNPNRGPNRTQ